MNRILAVFILVSFVFSAPAQAVAGMVKEYQDMEKDLIDIIDEGRRKVEEMRRLEEQRKTEETRKFEEQRKAEEMKAAAAPPVYEHKEEKSGGWLWKTLLGVALIGGIAAAAAAGGAGGGGDDGGGGGGDSGASVHIGW